MSMILGDETGQPILFLILGTAGSLILANLAGVFRRRAILGPNRLADDESAQVMMGIAGVGLLAYGCFAWVVGQMLPNQRKMPEPQQVAINGGMELAVLIALIVATVLARPNGGLRRMGVGPSKLPKGIIYGFISILIVLPMMFWIEAGTEKLWEILHKPHPAAHDLLIILGKTESPWVRLAIVVIAVGAAPAAEEMFFRGCIQTFLRYSLGHPWPAVILTSILFAMAHDVWTWPPIFFLGICLGYLYERTGNLWANITLHALFNLASILIYSHWGH